MPNVKAAHLRNYKQARSEHFTSWMIGMIRDFCVTTLRLHVSGDFFDAEYTTKWLQIVRANRRVTFYAYSRSWVVDEIHPVLLELGREKNFRLWHSFDHTMPTPKKVAGVRRCYVMTNDQDLPPCRVDLVFRDDSKTVLKRLETGELVCPPENGVTNTTCSKCQLCFLSRPQSRRTGTKLT